MSTNATDGVPPSTSAPSSTTPTSQPPPQAQQPLQPPQQPQAQASSAAAQSSVGGDSLTCQWSNCGERCATPEQLYDHVCERHVGRKSTNNLNLTCQWGNCRTTTVKRDHITSHIRVHVPLKPHKCDFCGKAFKRPQDLKKHVKTHADDSVLLRSPEPNRGAPHGGPGGGYQAASGKPGGFYPDTSMGGAPQYGHPQGGPNQAYYPTTAPAAYGQVYYAVNQNQSLQSDYEIRKRAAYDALNEFFGDAKRRAIDTTNYHEVGNRLMAIAPAVGYYGGMPEYSAAPVMASPGGVHGPLPTPQYSLPLPNLRTKSDLQQIDQFLEQLQTSAYENSNQAAAAGVAQPGAHYVHPSVSYRTSNSPPGAHATGTLPQTSHATAHAPLSAQPSTETPALTPASSVLSYTSGQSPNSVHSSNTISPTSRSNMGSMYPTLPSVSAMSDMAGNYAATSSAAAPALAPSFEDNRRRYSGPMLRKAAPARRSSDHMDVDDSPSPKNAYFSRRSSASVERDGLRKLALGSPGLDPALQSLMRSPLQRSSSSSSTNPADAEQERWIENIRTIEFLRNMVKDRLERGEFEDDQRRHSTPRAGHMTEDEQNLYPVLRHVQDS